jgi:hypothetical protein
VADINDRLDRLHRREAFDQRAAKPGTSSPAPEPTPAPAPPEHAQAAAAVQRSRSGLPQRVPAGAGSADPAPTRAAPHPPAQPVAARPGPAQQWPRSGLPQRAPGQAAAAHRSATGAAFAARSAAAEPYRPEPAGKLPELGIGEAFAVPPALAEPYQRPEPAEKPPRPVAARPAGVDDRLGEVLDAVADVVRRHRGLSVMVAVADGRPGRPVIRVTERAGEVVTRVVVVGAEPAPTATPTREPEPAPAPEPRRQGGRHAAPAAEDADDPESQDWGTPAGPAARSSWHYALWSADRVATASAPDRRTEHGGLRLVPDLEPAADAEAPVGVVAVSAGSSQIVSRLAQLLREDPSLATSWGREASDS